MSSGYHKEGGSLRLTEINLHVPTTAAGTRLGGCSMQLTITIPHIGIPQKHGPHNVIMQENVLPCCNQPRIEKDLSLSAYRYLRVGRPLFRERYAQ